MATPRTVNPAPRAIIGATFAPCGSATVYELLGAILAEPAREPGAFDHWHSAAYLQGAALLRASLAPFASHGDRKRARRDAKRPPAGKRPRR